MNVSKSKSTPFFVTSILLTILVVFSFSLSIAVNSKGKEVAQAEAIIAGTPSVLNLNERGVEKDYFSSVITGKQNESIYFGSNVTSTTEYATGYKNTHTGAIKWRVLSVNDTKYGKDGSWLLWADYQLGTAQYNTVLYNPNYGYWGTSKIRAQLNGGYYLDVAASNSNALPTLNSKIEDNDSYLNKIFGEQEILYVIDTNSYETKLYKYDDTSTPTLKTTNIIGTGNSQYTKTSIDSVAGTYAHEDGTGIIEDTTDKLFLLDYYDMNNTVYGFGDNGIIYAKLLNPNWDTETAGYPSYFDDNGAKTANYLKFSGDINATYMLRPAARYRDYICHSLAGHSSGYLTNININSPSGVRPAFNFNPTDIIYATSASVSSNGDTFAQVNSIASADGKPAYKIYIKTADYKNYNESANSTQAPRITVNGNNVNVTKSGQSGSAIILLADRSGNGKVLYQATAPFSNGVATATLPSGVNIGDYSITVLFADKVRSGEYAESITGSYTKVILATPQTVPTIYNGVEQTLETLKSKIDWYSAAFEDSSAVQVEYLTEDEKPIDTDYPKNQGNYKVRLTILKTDDYYWADKKNDSDITRTVDFVISPKKLSVDFTLDKTKIPAVATATPTNLCKEDSEMADRILRIHFTGTTGKIKYDEYGIAPSQVGNYVAAVEINPAEDVYGNYELDGTYSDSIKIDPQVVKLPTVIPETGSGWYTYNGKKQYYIIDGYNSAFMDAEIANGFADKIDDLDEDTITVTNAGNYENAIKITLKNAYDSETGAGLYVWNASSRDSQPKYLTFKVEKDEIKVDVYIAGNKSKEIIEGIIGTASLDVMIELDKRPADSLNLILTAQVGTSEPVPISNLNINSLTATASLNISSFKSVRTYTIDVIGQSDNYVISMSRKISLSMIRVDNPYLIWIIRDTEGIPYTVEVEDTNNPNVEFDETKFVYNGKAFSIEVSAPSGYGVQGAVTTVLENTSTAISEIKNAGTYITTVTIAKDNDNTAQIIYTIKWTIDKATLNMSGVKWLGNGKVEYTGNDIEMILEGLPAQLTAVYGGNKVGSSVGTQGQVSVDQFVLTGDADGNYEIPDINEWTIIWEIVPAKIAIGNRSDWKIDTYNNEDEGYKFDYYRLADTKADGIIEYEYYETDNTGKILDGAEAIESLDDIEFSATVRRYYKALPKLIDKNNYQFAEGVTGDDLYSPFFTVGGGASEVSVSISSDKIEYNGKPRNVKLVINGSGATLNDFELIYYSGDIADEARKLDGAPTDKGNYLVVIKSKKDTVVISGKYQYTFEIISATISKSWNKDAKPYVLKLKYGQIDGIEYVMADADGNVVEYGELTAGNTYQIKAKIKDNMQGNYSFTDGTYETDWEIFELRAEDLASMQDPNDPSNIRYPQGENEDPDEPEEPDNNPGNIGSGDDQSGNVPDSGDDNKGGSGALDELLEKIKDIPLWQLIASVISIILIIIFLSKTAEYESKRKKYNKKADKLDNVYAGAFLGLAMAGWTAIACVLMALAVVSFVIMIIAKNRCNKAEEEYEERLDEYQRNKADIDERKRDENMRMMFMGMMSGNAGGNMGQGMPQGGYMGYGMGPDEMRGIISETVTALLPNMQQALPAQASTNDELMQKLIEQNEKLIQQLAEKPQEIAVANANDEAIKSLIEGQKLIMEKLANQSNEQQVVEKIVEVPVEKIVEKVVEKEVKVHEHAEPKPKKEKAPRLTLDEAYAMLSKQQKKYFDGLREYALSKQGAKEKKSTYSITIGQSTVNPLLKLTIKKDTTVALFKMEDEYLKDIKRDASGDGTKIKVKETEVVIADAQACKAAKNMIDLREDQIERYNDLLKEQRALNRKK